MHAADPNPTCPIESIHRIHCLLYVANRRCLSHNCISASSSACVFGLFFCGLAAAAGLAETGLSTSILVSFAAFCFARPTLAAPVVTFGGAVFLAIVGDALGFEVDAIRFWRFALALFLRLAF